MLILCSANIGRAVELQFILKGYSLNKQTKKYNIYINTKYSNKKISVEIYSEYSQTAARQLTFVAICASKTRTFRRPVSF